eukprot:6562135-Prymnesium_polylepis.2
MTTSSYFNLSKKSSRRQRERQWNVTRAFYNSNMPTWKLDMHMDTRAHERDGKREVPNLAHAYMSHAGQTIAFECT